MLSHNYNIIYTFVTAFAKRGLIHASDLATLKRYKFHL